MSRDVKSRKPAPKKKSGGGTLIGMFIGLVLGVLIAAGVVWYMNKTPVPFVNKVQQVPSSTNPGQAPMALPGKPGDPVPEKRPRRQASFPRRIFEKLSYLLLSCLIAHFFEPILRLFRWNRRPKLFRLRFLPPIRKKLPCSSKDPILFCLQKRE